MSEPQKFTSVTSIEKDGCPKPGIPYWAAKGAARYVIDHWKSLAPQIEDDPVAAFNTIRDAPWRERDKAANRGTEIHTIAEKINLGQQPDVPEELAPYIDQYLGFLADYRPTFLMAEAQVWNVTYSYAGTLDAIVEIGGDGPYVLDMKTTPKPPDTDESRPPYPNIAIQLCMYAHAEKVALVPAERVTTGRGRYYLYDESLPFEPMPRVDGALALVVSPFDYTLTPVRIDNEVWNAALAVREVARFQSDISKRVLGPQVPRPVKEAA